MPFPVPAESAPVAEAIPISADTAPELAPESTVTVAPAPTFAHADIWPKRGRIVFQVTRGGEGFVVGQAEHRWHHDGMNYEVRAATETVGLAALFKPARVEQESRGGLVAAGLQPLDYSLSRDGKLKEGARFDATQRRIFLGNGHSATYRDNTQDMLSLFYQLGAYSFETDQFVISVASGRKVAFFTVSVGASEVLATPLGERTARHLKINGPAREDATEIWLDTQTRLPLKIRHRDRKGEIFDQIAATIELDSPP
jgi:ferric-dicitrate binding protein FerR (iron transport regulator)